MSETPNTVFSARFKQRILIQQSLDTPNTSGGAVRTWQTVSGCSSVPAEIVYPTPSKKGDEQIAQQQKRSAVFVTITIRYRPSTNIDASMQVLFGTRIFDIRTVIPDDMDKKTIVLQCEEIQGKGSFHA